MLNTILSDLSNNLGNIQFDQERDPYEAFSRYYFEPLITANFIYEELGKLDSNEQQQFTKMLTDQCQRIYRLFHRLRKNYPNKSWDSHVVSPDTAQRLESTSKIVHELPNITPKEKEQLEERIDRELIKYHGVNGRLQKIQEIWKKFGVSDIGRTDDRWDCLWGSSLVLLLCVVLF